MTDYEPHVMEIVGFGTNDQWNDVVCSLPGWSGPAADKGEYSDM